jgi:D-alanyl-D-alanine carboxypeptidase/D-alanyl-D-alanine-endopeptidase (penicillin-binding protein 4)
VEVAGGPATGRAPAGASEIARIESAPLTAVVRQLLEESDNGTAELLTKELGLASSGEGSTVAGTAHVRRRAAELGVPVDGTLLADGSGLDRNNRTTCDALVEALIRSGGPDGPLAASLPVAGRSGTLRGRFRGTPAEGRLRAKTGSLNEVTALAGFVEMPDGQVATFAYIANGPQADDPRRGQDFLGALLGQYEQVCSETAGGAVVAPVGAYALGAAALAPVGAATLLAPGLVVALDGFEANPGGIVDSCLAGDPSFELTLSG